MTFRYFAAILLGMVLIGLSLGFVLGYYAHHVLHSPFWAYLAAPVLGLGSGLTVYGSLYRRRSED